tara:strand:- start:110 stop:727 length:618 start_codon:yes stop_codon:yes gene_type:complete
MARKKGLKNYIISKHRDPFFKKAKNTGYRSRSAFKLIELNKKFKFIKSNSTVIDLGSAPGGWSQVVSQLIKRGITLSVDLKDMEIIKGVKFLKLDFLEEQNKKKIIEAINTKADIVLSDMAADTTGNKNLDCIRTNHLCAEVIEFARFVLKDTGVVVSKLFNGTDFIKVKNLAKKNFKKVNFFKPKSSKDASKETYIHCEGIKTL